jgi:hypothetical protein
MATGIGSVALSPCSASSVNSVVNPAASSPMWHLATNWPRSSTSATSWWFSAQSIPQNTFMECPFLVVFGHRTELGHAPH